MTGNSEVILQQYNSTCLVSRVTGHLPLAGIPDIR